MSNFASFRGQESREQITSIGSPTVIDLSNQSIDYWYLIEELVHIIMKMISGSSFGKLINGRTKLYK